MRIPWDSAGLYVYVGRNNLANKRFNRNIWIAVGVILFIACIIALFTLGGDGHTGAH